MVEADE